MNRRHQLERKCSPAASECRSLCRIYYRAKWIAGRRILESCYPRVRDNITDKQTLLCIPRRRVYGVGKCFFRCVANVSHFPQSQANTITVATIIVASNITIIARKLFTCIATKQF